MKTYLQNIIPQLQNFSLSLDKTAILINKPWALIDEDGEIQKLIFKKSKELILSKNGQVTEGKWDYFPEAKSLLIDRGSDKILCNEAFIDNGVLIMKMDGTNNQFFILANQNIIPDLNVRKYLMYLRRIKLALIERRLYDGRKIEIGENSINKHGLGSHVTIDAEPLEDGKYKLDNNNYYLVKKNKISGVLTEVKFTNPDKKEIFIHKHNNHFYNPKNGDYVYIEGMPAEDGVINFSKSKNLIVRDGRVVRFESKNTFTRAFSKGWKKFFGVYKE